MQLLPALEKQGVPFGSDLLEYTPLPAAMVEKWKQLIKQREVQAKQNPGPPPPQMISAMANMKRADAAMIAAQGKTQGDQMKVQADAMKMQQEAQMQPFEQQLAMQEIQLKAREQELQARELDVREREAMASIITAQSNARAAQMESLGLRGEK
jgi:hypothetical protein